MDILNIIQNVGFPIACVLGMGYYIMKMNQHYREDIKGLTDKQDEQIEKLRSALENNTLAILHLSDVLDHENKRTEKDGEDNA